MSKEVKKKVTKGNSFETLKALYYSGKVKPSLNKIIVELKNDPTNLSLTLLACQCLVKTKNYEDLSTYANAAVELEPQHPEGHFYKGIAFHHIKGKEQEALKNFNEALTMDPVNTVYLKNKAVTHFSLYTDYHLPIQFAEKHRVKAEESLLKVVDVVEAMVQPTYLDYLTLADVYIMLTLNLNAKKYYLKAVNAYENADELDQDRNIYKEIISSQKACIKLIEKFTE